MKGLNKFPFLNRTGYCIYNIYLFITCVLSGSCMYDLQFAWKCTVTQQSILKWDLGELLYTFPWDMLFRKSSISWPQFWTLYSLLPMPWPWSFSALQKYTNNCIAVRWWLTADTANRIRPWHFLAVHLWNKVAGCMDTQTSGCHQGVCWQAPSADKVSVLETKNLFSVTKMGDSSCKKEPGWFRDVHLKWTKTQNRTQRQRR